MKPSGSPQNQRGSIVTYLLVGIFLLGVLTLSVSEGPRKSAQSNQIDQMVMDIQNDLDVIESAVNDCVNVYPTPVDIDEDGDKDATDNPNAPYPRHYFTQAGSSYYSDNGAIVPTASTFIVCPGAPPTPLKSAALPSMTQSLFANKPGRQFRVIGDPAKYTATFTNDATEGVRVYIRPVATETTAWREAAARINTRNSVCKVRVASNVAGVCPGTNRTCIFMWLKPRASSTTIYDAECTVGNF